MAYASVYSVVTDIQHLAYMPEDDFPGMQPEPPDLYREVPEGDWTAFVSPYSVSLDSGIGLSLELESGELLELVAHAQPPPDTSDTVYVQFPGRQITLRVECEEGIVSFSYAEDETDWVEMARFSPASPVSRVGLVLRYDREDLPASAQAGQFRLLYGVWQNVIEEHEVAPVEVTTVALRTAPAPQATVTSTTEPLVHVIVGAQFGDLEFDVGKSVRWVTWFCDNVFVLDVNLGDPRYWIVNWAETFPDAKHTVTGINYFVRPTEFRAEQWRQYCLAFGEPHDDDWILWVDAHEGLNIDNRTLPNDYDFEPFKSFLWREIQRAQDLGQNYAVLPYYVFLRSDNIVNVTYPIVADTGDMDIGPLQAISTPYYQAHQGLKRLWKASELKKANFDWSQMDVVTTSSGGAKTALVSYGYAHWNLQDIEPPATTVPPLTAANDDGWRMRNLLSKVRPIPGLPIGDTWVPPSSDPAGLPGPWAPADINNPDPIVQSGPYLSPTVSTVSSPDTPDMTVDGDVRFTSKVKIKLLPAQSQYLGGQRSFGQLVFEAQPLPNNGLGYYARMFNGVSQVPGGPSASAAQLTAVGVRDNADVYLGHQIERAVLRSTILTSLDGVTWTPIGTGVTAAAGTQVPLDPNEALVLGTSPGAISPWQGRIYWAQMEAIHRARMVFPGVVGNVITTPHSAAWDALTGDMEVVCRASVDSWYDGTTQGFCYKGVTGARTFLFRKSGSSLQFVYTPVGASVATLGVAFPAGLTNQLVWWKATYDADNGAGGRTAQLYYSLADTVTEPTTWTALGSSQVTTPAAGLTIGNTWPAVVGADDPTRAMKGRITRLIVRNGIGGTTVLDVAENNAGTMLSPTTFAASSGQTMTVSGTGPRPYLNPTIGLASTPDAPDLTIDGDVRITAWMRDESDEAATVRDIVRRIGNGEYMWRACTSVNSLHVQGFPSGATVPIHGGPVATRTELGLTPPHTDRFVGFTIRGVATVGTLLRLDGLTSLDGQTWTPTGTPRTGIDSAAFSRVSTAACPVGIGAGFLGRFYWVQMEAINRVRFMFPGVVGNYLSTPDAPNLQITDDIELVARLAPMNWSALQVIANKDYGIAPRGWHFRLTASGAINLACYLDGSILTQGSSSPVGGVAGQARWVKATRNAATGALAFYHAPDSPTEPTSWTAAGTVAGTAGLIGAATSPIQIGARQSGGTAEPFTGRIARTIVRNAIGIDKPQFVFPGYPGNYMALTQASGGSGSGDLEVVARVAFANLTSPAYEPIIAKRGGNNIEFMLRRVYGVKTFNLSWQDDASGIVQAGTSAALPGSIVNGQMFWLRARLVAATGVVSFDYALDQATEPTTWTTLGTATTVTNTVRRGNALPVMIGWDTSGNILGSTAGFGAMLNGRVSRAIVRNGIAGTAVIDVSEDNVPVAGVSSFTATTGQVVTVNERPPATFVFPGVAGNNLSVPHAANQQLVGDTEFVVRVGATNWATGTQQALFAKPGAYAFGANVGANFVTVFNFSDAPGVGIYAASSPHSFVNGQIYWVKVTRVQSTGLVSFYWAADSPTEPTTWTAMGTQTPAGSAGKTIATSTFAVLLGSIVSNQWPLGGRIARLIVRDGIAGTVVIDVNQDNASVGATSFAATTGGTVTANQTAGVTICQRDITTPWNKIVQGTVLDVNESNAHLGDTSFPATTKQTVTVTKTSYELLQSVPDKLVWRFDATEYPGTGTTWVDPRGRSWTISAAGAVVPAVSGAIVQPQADSLVWRYDAAEYPFGETPPTVYPDPRGRQWTLTNAAAVVPNTEDTMAQPVTPDASMLGLVTPLYDNAFRINMRDGVWYEEGLSGNIPLKWDDVNKRWTTDYDPAEWSDHGVKAYDPTAVP